MNIIFDVDGTLVDSGKMITDDMGEILTRVKDKLKCKFTIVGGGTYFKLKQQLSKYFDLFDYVFPECGSCGYYAGKMIYQKDFMNSVNKNSLNNIIKEFLLQIIKYDIIHAGHLIDRRSGLYYLSPSGMQASENERGDFIEKDKMYNIRKNLIAKLKSIDVNDEFEIVLGGNTGIALMLKGWNKSQILEYIDANKIFFFGDRTEPDGNDYPLFNHSRVEGYSVTNFNDTINKLELLFLS